MPTPPYTLMKYQTGKQRQQLLFQVVKRKHRCRINWASSLLNIIFSPKYSILTRSNGIRYSKSQIYDDGFNKPDFSGLQLEKYWDTLCGWRYNVCWVRVATRHGSERGTRSSPRTSCSTGSRWTISKSFTATNMAELTAATEECSRRSICRIDWCELRKTGLVTRYRPYTSMPGPEQSSRRHQVLWFIETGLQVLSGLWKLELSGLHLREVLY